MRLSASEVYPSSLRERFISLLYERGMGQSPRGARPLPSRLRPLAVILDRVWFTSLTRSQSNPLRGFGVSLIETKTRLCSLVFVSRRERDSNPRTCDSLRISRPAQSTTLASLQGSHNLVKILRFVYIFEFQWFISIFGRKFKGQTTSGL